VRPFRAGPVRATAPLLCMALHVDGGRGALPLLRGGLSSWERSDPRAGKGGSRGNRAVRGSPWPGSERAAPLSWPLTLIVGLAEPGRGRRGGGGGLAGTFRPGPGRRGADGPGRRAVRALALVTFSPLILPRYGPGGLGVG
jgi:hypothetical protein